MDMQELDMRYKDAYDFKSRWMGLYQQLYTYVIPDRDAFNVRFAYQDNAKPTTGGVWDTTAILSAYTRANEMHALLLPKERVWGKATLDSNLYDEREIQQKKPILDHVNERIMFYLNESNLARVTADANLDLIGGTAALWINNGNNVSDDKPLSFQAIPAVALQIEQTSDDLVGTCWYMNSMKARQILLDFPKYRGKDYGMLLSDQQREHQVIFGQVKQGSGSQEKYYIYAVLEADPLHVLWEVEHSYPQIIVYRDRVRPGEAEGRGIGIDLLPTIIDLNKMRQDDRKSKSNKARPTMFYDNDKMFNPYAVREWAGAMIARQPGHRNPVEAMNLPNYPEVMEDIRMMQDEIKKGFMVEPLGEIDDTVKSATEISIRENRAQRVSTTDIARLINELPKQVFMVAAKILGERGLLMKNRSDPGINFNRVKFNFQSPLYDKQKEADLEKLVQSLQMKQQFFGEGAAMASLNLGLTNEYINDRLDIPSKLSKTPEEIDLIQKHAGEQAEAEQQAQMQQGMPTPSTSGSDVSLPQGTPQQF